MTNSRHNWQVEESLTMTTVPDILKQFAKRYPKRGSWVIDLSKVDQFDSAGVAFLLHCMRYAKQHQIQLSVHGIQVSDVDLMKAQGVWALIEPLTH